ncbi:MAG TPA: hypothetical protein VK524_00510 [Polyangiaceae bacterium]|nr:hypothetical protein [Polyangiaceae bacterium]
MSVIQRLIAVVFCVAGASACKPDVGSSCEPDESRCLNSSTQLSCHDGRFIATPCRGRAGCGTSDHGVSCDISGNRAGDPCSSADEGAASCVAPAKMVVCRAGKYQFTECRGAQGCKNEAGRALCDTSIAESGDVCSKEGLKACGKDAKQVLSCQAGKMAFLYSCRGEQGCTASSGKLNCDMSVAQVEDVCDPRMDEKNACSSDGKAILVCRKGKFAVDEPCKAGTGCSTEGGGISCTKRERPSAP